MSKLPVVDILLMRGVGEVVSVSMSNGECIQGRLKSVDAETRTVCLERPFLNGRPLGGFERTFPINAIVSFKILDIKSKNNEETLRTSDDVADITDVEQANSSTDDSFVEQNSAEQDGKIPEKSSCIKATDAAGTSNRSRKSPEKQPAHQINLKSELRGSTINTPSAGNKMTSASDVLSPYHPKQSSCSSGSTGSTGSTSSSPLRSDTKPNRAFHGSEGKPKSPCMSNSSGRWRRNHGPYAIQESHVTEEEIRDSRNNAGLIKPIDFDLNEDFDFERNLEIFQNYEKKEHNVKQKGMSALNAQFSQLNYEHYENVVSDPARVTSWTTKIPNLFVVTRYETTVDGHRIPFMRCREKEKLLQKAEPYLGSDLFHVLIADRLMMFVWKIIHRFKIMVSQIVVLDSVAVNTFLTTMFLRHISNRACKTVVYSCLLGQYNLPHVEQVHDVDGLPQTDVQLIVVLGPVLLSNVKDWIKSKSSSAHVISIEKPSGLATFEHVLMVAVGTDPNDAEKGPKNSECLRAVVDIGIPFNWMDAESAACLSRTFATQNIVIC